MTEEQFNDFFATQFADVWRFARRRTDSAAEADDITAETFAVVWRRRADVPREEPRLWLFGVARHVLANHRRLAERQHRLNLRLASQDPPAVVWHDAPASEEVLWWALASLTADDRELLLMRAWDGLGVGEIANVLGISSANVSSRLHKARRRLETILQRREAALSGQVRTESHGDKE
jgi:RNA polymerase sigma-70 factor (ECF subfamily)